MSLSTEYMGLKLKNPIVVAAGPWSRDGASIQRSIDAGASAVVTETITLEANQNPSPRLYLSGSGQLFNTTLFSGIHLEQWEQEFESLRRGDCKLIASIWGNTPSELAYLAGKVERMGADAVEVSLSAPLGTRMDVGTVPREIFGFISAVTEAVDIPVAPIDGLWCYLYRIALFEGVASRRNACLGELNDLNGSGIVMTILCLACRTGYTVRIDQIADDSGNRVTGKLH